MAEEDKKDKDDVKKSAEGLAEHQSSSKYIKWIDTLKTKAKNFFFPDSSYSTNTRLIVIAIAIPVLLAVLVMLFSSWKDWDYQPLYGRLDKYDVALVVAQLEKAEISYRIHPDSGQVLVKKASLSGARMALAAGGVTPSLPAGKSIMDSPSPLGTSHFMERNRYIKALEGEMALTIMSLESVRNARVHLSVPEQTVFLKASEAPKASVYLELHAGNRLSHEQIEGILNLVSGSIANLDRLAVTIVDQFGNALSQQLKDSKYLAKSRRDLQLRTELETYLSERVGLLLEPLLGRENFQVQVAVDIDFSVREETSERFNPDKTALKSETSINAKEARGKGGIPGDFEEKDVLGSEEWEGKYVKNYDVDRLVSHVQRMPGRMQRLSVAVLLNYRVKEGGEIAPWSDAEIGRITTLVQHAVGYDLQRGDKVTVDSLRFVAIEDIISAEWADWQDRYLVYSLVIVGLFLGLLLYFYLKYRSRARTLKLLEEAALLEAERIEKEKEEEPKEGTEGSPATTERKGSEEADDVFEDYIVELTGNKSLKRRITVFRALSRKYPERVAKVIERWIKLGEPEKMETEEAKEVQRKESVQ